MFVPFDRLYDFLRHYVDEDVIIYRFFPAGSRKLSDIVQEENHCKIKRTWKENKLSLTMLIHDQEPLNFEFYQKHEFNELEKFCKKNFVLYFNELSKFELDSLLVNHMEQANLRLFQINKISDQWMLSHSELNSPDLKKYEEIGAVGVYWWSHAVIAQDWYRFAKIDPDLNYKEVEFPLDFNIYNRDWTGSREYRLKFTELVLDKDLHIRSSIKFSPQSQGLDYRDHEFKNKDFVISQDLSILPINDANSDSSADYNRDDYKNCAIDVVLETLFDDQRIHLTEKTLRPIACGKPFVLVSTPGSLDYLRNYGFKTFGDVIDESYDTISDPLTRLETIIELLDNLSRSSDKKSIYKRMHEIARENQKRFWSDDFTKIVWDEFEKNYQEAYEKCKKSFTGHNLIEFRKLLYSSNTEYRRYLTGDIPGRQSRKDILDIMLLVRQQRSNS